LLRSDEGGRTGGIRSGYRPNHNFGEADDQVFYIGQIEFEGRETIEPGESREVLVTFISGPGLELALQPGRRWRIQEGPRLVATAVLLEVLSEI